LPDDIRGPELRLDRIERRNRLWPARQIRRVRKELLGVVAACGADFFQRLREPLLVSCYDRDVRTLLREQDRNRFAHALGATGYYHHLGIPHELALCVG
jgi:hypothetical protein